MMIWGTQVTPLQMFGYSIALGGLVYYKLGADVIKEHLSHGGRMWADYGAKHPAMRKMIGLGVILLTILLTMVMLASRYAPQYDPKSYLAHSKYLTSLVGDKAA